MHSGGFSIIQRELEKMLDASNKAKSYFSFSIASHDPISIVQYPGVHKERARK
jgi:hypothetical protein